MENVLVVAQRRLKGNSNNNTSLLSSPPTPHQEEKKEEEKERRKEHAGACGVQSGCTTAQHLASQKLTNTTGDLKDRVVV